MRVLQLVAFACVLSLALGDAPPANQPFLIAQKSIDTEGFAVGVNMTVTLRIINTGSTPAYDVNVVDSWPYEHFSLLDGINSTSYDVILAGEKKELAFTLAPKAPGRFKGFPALVQYKEKIGGEDIVVVSTSSREQISIMPYETFRRWVASHDLENYGFGVGVLLSIMVPAIVQTYYSRNYNLGAKVYHPKSE